ncbi:MAG: molybdenum cofactor biosynthesis protein MoaE [Deltaproteobacteria bacterium]|nr:molybdenum cofactor biosynthesis protein MoaE [Deltaproteobacteria bacterium]
MDLNNALARIQGHPEFSQAGMVLIHYGLVRSFNLKGQEVKSLDLKVNQARAEEIRTEFLKRPGVVDIVVEFNPGRLKVGDPIMLAAVAGQTRDQVFPVLEEMVDRLKKEATGKEEEVV